MTHCIVCDDGRVAPMRSGGDGDRVGSVDSRFDMSIQDLLHQVDE